MATISRPPLNSASQDTVVFNLSTPPKKRTSLPKSQSTSRLNGLNSRPTLNKSHPSPAKTSSGKKLENASTFPHLTEITPDENLNKNAGIFSENLPEKPSWSTPIPKLLDFTSSQLKNLQEHFSLTPSTSPHIIADITLLFSVLIAANLLIHPEDLGWTQLSTSPYLLLPLIIGGRYGTFYGTLAATLAISSLIIIQGLPPAPLNTLLPFLVTGLIAGSLQNFLYRKIKHKNQLLDDANLLLFEQDHEIEKLRYHHDELNKVLKKMRTGVSSLDFSIRRIYQCKDTEIYPQILTLLHDKVHISQAAFYSLTASGTLNRLAFNGDAAPFPESMSQKQNPLILKAIQDKKASIHPDLWTSKLKDSADPLIVIPLVTRNHEISSLLLISHLHFTSLNSRAIHSIQIICQWASRFIEEKNHTEGSYRLAGSNSQRKIYSATRFRETLHLAHETYRYLHLPTAIVTFYLPGENSEKQTAFEDLLTPIFRVGDIPSCIKADTPNIVLLLPLTSYRGAELCAQRIGKAFSEASPNLEKTLSTEVSLIQETPTPKTFEKKIKSILNSDSKVA